MTTSRWVALRGTLVRLLHGLVVAAVAGLFTWFGHSVVHYGIQGAKGVRIFYDQFHVRRHFVTGRNIKGAWKYHDVSGYYDFRQTLERAGYDVRVHKKGRLKPGMLDDYDIYFIGEQTAQATWMTDKEREILFDWVEAGGGLWTVVEHTDAHGMATHWNAWMGDLEIEARYDSICEPNGTVDSKDWVRMSDFAEHPITEGLEEVYFYNGCSFDTPHAIAWSSEDSWSDAWNPDDPPVHNGDNFRGADELGGPLAALAAMEHGSGRVAATCDHNAFANPTLYQGSHVRLLHNAMAWLGGERTNPDLKWAMLAFVGLVGLGAAGVATRLRPVGLTAWALVGTLVSGGVTWQQTHEPGRRDILFTDSNSPDAGARSKDREDFFTFFQHVLKVEDHYAWLMPTLTGGWDAIVLTAPTEPLDEDQLRVLDDTLEDGRTVVYLATAASLHSPAGTQILGRWNLSAGLRAGSRGPGRSFTPDGLERLHRGVDEVYVPAEAPRSRVDESDDATQVVLRLEAGSETIDFITETQVGPGRVVLITPAEILGNRAVRRRATRVQSVDLIANLSRWIAE